VTPSLQHYKSLLVLTVSGGDVAPICCIDQRLE